MVSGSVGYCLGSFVGNVGNILYSALFPNWITMTVHILDTDIICDLFNNEDNIIFK